MPLFHPSLPAITLLGRTLAMGREVPAAKEQLFARSDFQYPSPLPLIRNSYYSPTFACN